MPNILEIEENEKLLPVLCLFGYLPNLREELVRLNTKKFRIIIVGARKPNFLEDYPEVYFITYKNAKILEKLEEKIDYSMIFISDKEAVKNINLLLGKLQKDKSQTIAILSTTTLVESLSNIESVKSISNLRYCILGEILSPKSKNESDLSKIIENAIINQEIVLSGREEQRTFGITVDDAILGLQRILFGNFRKDTIHCLFYKHPETILEATHMIARVEPEIKIVFSDVTTKSLDIKEPISQTIFKMSGMDISYVDSLSGFEKGIEKFLNQKSDFEESRLYKNKRRKKKRKNTPLASALKFFLVSFVAGAFLFVFLNFLFFGIGMLFLRQSINDIQTGNFLEASSNAKRSNFFLSTVQPTIELSFDLLSNIDKQGQAQQTYRLLRKAGELSDISGSTISTILKNSSISESELLTSIANFTFIFQEGQRINEKTKNNSLSSELKDTYSNLLSLSQVLPKVLGFEGEQKYLLLIQNNEELRPTGGFISSAGDLVIKSGRVEKLKVNNVYSLDSKLNNHFEPPFIIRKYLQPHLYLRDSNFGLDFQESASKSAQIYNLETGSEPAAVIAIDLDVLKEILKISGPIKLPSYNVVVDDQTVEQFLQGTIKDNNFPGTAEKEDILNALFAELIAKTKKDSKFNIAVIKKLPDLLETKHILVSFSDNSVQKVFSANGYGGSYEDIRPNNQKQINDYFYVNEANIGGNKVNPLVSRTIAYRAMLGEDSLNSQLTLKLTNASKIDDYKAYLTFVVPGGSFLKKISIDRVEQSLAAAVTDPAIYEQPGFVNPAGLETEQYSKDNLTHIAFTVNVSKNEKKEITIEYENGAKKNLSSITRYSLLINKEPGIDPLIISTSYEYPEGYTPLGITADSYGSNFLEKKYSLKDDLLTEFELQKKRQ